MGALLIDIAIVCAQLGIDINKYKKILERDADMENKISFEELEERNDWEKAVIVFTDESLGGKGYSLEERSYEVSSKAKFFDPTMNGRSLFGNCLDGKDLGIRLDMYMSQPKGQRWEVEYCYIIK